jgi:hypothetical protein
MTFAELITVRPWKAIRDCPGRYVLPPTAEAPASLAGIDSPPREFRLATARDPIVVVTFADGGGLISYRRADSSYIHTLNTAEGFARKLEQLGIPG